MLEDYRAGLTVDRQHEETDRAARRGIDSGHHMAEEAPEALAGALGDFFSPLSGLRAGSATTSPG